MGSVLTLMMMATLAAAPVGAAERVIELDGVKNTRDLGGLTAQGGRSVRTGALVRSGKIDGITAAGMSDVDARGVTVVIDLRTTMEATKHPATWPEKTGPKRYNFPLMENEAELIEEMETSIASGTADPEHTEALFHDAFGYIATDYTKAIRGVFDVLLELPPGETALFHCSGGKDRTGVVTALLLSVLGVSRDQIETDFLMSNDAHDPDRASQHIAATINEKNGTEMPAAAVWPALGVRPAYLQNFYDSVEAEFGSVDGYLRKGLGLTDADIDRLQQKYLQ